MKRMTTVFTSSLLLLDLGACVFPDKQIGDGDDDLGSDEASTNDDQPDGEGDTGTSLDETAEGESGPSEDCEPPFPSPAHDEDCDEVGIYCDNARDHRNPDQLDQDGDLFGDVADLCPLLASDTNTADSDRDGIGNACDLCPKQSALYNEVFGPGVDVRMWVRNVPSGGDFDQDGIGDVCDNCVTVPNCSNYGPANPAPLGAEAGELADCQIDEDADGIGDACAGELVPPPQSAGPIGFSSNDDFDQDGLINVEDGCPRQPANLVVCTSDEDCGPGSRCAVTPTLDGDRHCNHLDVDADNVGDICDTCPSTPNPLQVVDGGMQLDDQDGDFIGADCETNVQCSITVDPRPIGHYDISVAGYCCVTTWPGDDVLHDPEGKPIRRICSGEDEEAGLCRKLPASVAAMPGVVELPFGCEDALAEATLDEALPLTLSDFGGDAELLQRYACILPAWDQDFDGLGDACDLCPFGFDPLNEPYVDNEGQLWPNAGRFCSGDYAPELVPGAACEWP